MNYHTKSSSQWWFWCPWWGPKSWQGISVSWALQILIGSLTDRVAEVGRLSSNTKKSFNFVVGRTFANLRLKMLFLFVLPKSQTFDNDTVHVQYGTISFYVFRLDFRFPNILFQNPWFSPPNNLKAPTIFACPWSFPGCSRGNDPQNYTNKVRMWKWSQV